VTNAGVRVVCWEVPSLRNLNGKILADPRLHPLHEWLDLAKNLRVARAEGGTAMLRWQGHITGRLRVLRAL